MERLITYSVNIALKWNYNFKITLLFLLKYNIIQKVFISLLS